MKYFAAALLALFLAGCAAGPQLPTQYATLKLIESERVTAEQVTERVERLRALLDHGVALDLAELQSAIDWDGLAPSDRLLVAAIVGDLELGVDTPIGDDTRADLLQRLAWIEQAAAMAD